MATVLAACGFCAGCHSTTAPSPSPSQPAEPVLSFTATTTATLSHLDSQWYVNYLFCFSVHALSTDVAAMIVNRVDYTLLDAAGQAYRSFTDGSGLNVGQPIGQTPGGCIKFADVDWARPVAPTFHASIQFGGGVSAWFSRSLDAAVTNNVPPKPFIDSIALTDDIPGAQHILFTRRPITFTVTKVNGGSPPFFYQFKINGFVMRDWSDNLTWVWDAQTLNNAPVVSGGYTCAVLVRQGNFPSEAVAATSFTLVFSGATDTSRHRAP